MSKPLLSVQASCQDRCSDEPKANRRRLQAHNEGSFLLQDVLRPVIVFQPSQDVRVLFVV